MRPGGVFELDRTLKFGFRDQLDLNIVVDWVIAEHKTQGWSIARARALFERLRQ